MTDNTDAQDADAMADLGAGSERALNELMDRHSEKLFHYLIRVLQNKEDAAEVAQEAFVRVYQNRNKFKADQKFTTWLYAIATNLSRDRLRWRSRHPAVSLDEMTAEGSPSLDAAHQPTPRDHVESAEVSDLIARAVAALPEDLRVPFILTQYQELSQSEVSAILHCSVKAVETRLYRARKQLRESLEQLV